MITVSGLFKSRYPDCPGYRIHGTSTKWKIHMKITLNNAIPFNFKMCIYMYMYLNEQSEW